MQSSKTVSDVWETICVKNNNGFIITCGEETGVVAAWKKVNVNLNITGLNLIWWVTTRLLQNLFKNLK